MLKRGLLCAALAAVLMFPALSGARTVLAPGVTYERELMFSGGRPVVLHVVRTPPPSDLYRLRPVLSRGTVLGHTTVPTMQARLSPHATTVGVNGDFFNAEAGNVSGLFMRDGVLSSRPSRRRSALALGLDGRLLVDRFRFVGTWRAGAGTAHRLDDLNRPLQSLPRVGLFTRTWGGVTPRVRGAVEIVLAGFPRSRLNADLTGTVTAVVRGGGTPVPPGGAVIQARRSARRELLVEAPAGTVVTVRLRVPALPDDTLDAIGGGPVLVRDGRPIAHADEMFTLDQIARRHPRTAVGQLRDGRLLFVVADGRSSWSYGLTTAAMARAMADLGAVTAMGFDGGGSSTIAFDGRVLNTPSDGRPRRVASGLFLHYYGIYAPAVNGTILSPNGDGVGDSKALAAKVVRTSDVHLRIVRPDGSVAWNRRDVRGPGWIRRVVSSRAMAEGRWRWEAEATDTVTGEQTRIGRVFDVNKTLGHLRLSRERMLLRPRRGGRLGASVLLTRRARLEVVVLRAGGRFRRVLLRGERGPGRHAWRWNGRNKAGRLVDAGTFTIRVTAGNQLGTVALRDTVRVVRARPR